MVEDDFTRLARLMSFVSEEQDSTAQRDRPISRYISLLLPLFLLPIETQGPPKALDDDETKFLDNLETMRQGSMFSYSFMLSSRKEYERKIADKEAQHLLSFQAALAAKSSTVQELKEASSVPIIQKAKIHQGGSEEPTNTTKTPHVDTENTLEVMKTLDGGIDKSSVVAKTGLVSCSDDSEDD
ncbi:unnamed protein product [Malus baccata var. baccata]